jgi:hypothetical protein
MVMSPIRRSIVTIRENNSVPHYLFERRHCGKVLSAPCGQMINSRAAYDVAAFVPPGGLVA